VLRVLTQKLRDGQAAGLAPQAVAIGNKGLGFLGRNGIKVVAQVTQLGDTPHLERLIGPVKVLLDAYVKGEVSAVHLCYTRFINTMKQEPMVEQLLPLSAARLEQTEAEKKQYGWDYIYEPDPATVIDELLTRYIETLVFQAVAENMASEQSARMVAMKAATENAGSLIGDLYQSTLQYPCPFMITLGVHVLDAEATRSWAYLKAARATTNSSRRVRLMKANIAPPNVAKGRICSVMAGTRKSVRKASPRAVTLLMSPARRNNSTKSIRNTSTKIVAKTARMARVKRAAR
jgi:hypothetical protein